MKRYYPAPLAIGYAAPGNLRFRPRPTTIALAVCALLGGGGHTWAACTAAPSASTPDPVTGILAPASGDTVTCSGTSAVSVSSLVATGSPTVFSNSATGVTVNNTGNLTPATTQTAIALGAGTQITNDGVITADNVSGNLGAIALWGAGNRIVNRGTINALNSEAIQGLVSNPSWQAATGVVLENSGVISSSSNISSPGTGVIKLGAGAQVTNSGEIRLLSSEGAVALQVGDGSRIENQASGLIRAEEIVGASSGTGSVNAIRSAGAATVVNAGRIEVIGDVNGPGRGVAVSLTGGGTIANTGTIDASRGGIAISAQAPVSLVNSGTIRGGTGNAISLSNSEGSEVTLQTGSQITGTVSVRRIDSVLKTLQDWQAQFPTALNQAQRAYDLCQQSANPSTGCFKSISALPNQATLRLQGTGAEDDRLTGFNQIEKIGAGNWTLATPLQAGSADHTTGDFRGPLRVNVADAAGQLGLSGSITDAADGTKGQLVKDGAGILALSGNNTYSGPTTINAGRLQVTGGNAIGDNSAVTVASGATLEVVLTSQGQSNVNITSEKIGSLAGDGSVLLNQRTFLIVGNDNTSTTFGGSIDGPGALIKNGTGTLRLTGTSTGTGTLTVSEGTLDAAGTVPMNTLVQRDASGQRFGTLIGNGTVGSLTNKGIVAPGNSIGMLTVTGNYTQSSTGILNIEIAPNGGGADLLAVGGAATLAGTLTARGENGALLTPGAGGSATSPKLYTILTAGGGVSGTFGTVPAALGAFTFNTIYNPNNVQLGVTYAGFSAVQAPGVIPGTGTTNQKTKAKYLDSVPIVSGNYASGNSDFDRVLLEIANETPDQLANTYNAIIAEPYAAFMTVLLNQNDFYANNVMDRAQACSLRGRATLGGAFAPETDGVNGKRGEGSCDPASRQRRYGGWVDATWVRGSVDGDNGLSGYNYQMGGVVLGADASVSSNVAIGVAGGFGKPKLYDYDLAKAEVDGSSYFLSAYGTLTQDQWEFAGVLGYTFGSYDGKRGINFGSINRQASSNFDGQGVIASLKAAYFQQMGRLEIVPEFGLTYSKIWQGGFTETGAGSLNLKVDDADAYSVVTSLGVLLGTSLEAGSTPLRLQGLLRYDHDWNAGNDNAHRVTASLAEVPALGSMSIIGQNRGANGFTVGGAATALVTKNIDLFAGATYRWNDNGNEYTLGAGARGWW